MEQEEWDLGDFACAALDAADDEPLDHIKNHNATLAAQSVVSQALLDQRQVPLTPFSHPPLVFRQSTTTRFPNQQVQAVRSRSQSDISQSRSGMSRGRPASPRCRSRSPTAATHPLIYRDRSQEATASRHQVTAVPDHDVGGDVIITPVGGARRLRLEKLATEKNDYGVCITCWLNEQPCDHQWPCRECKASGLSCAYVTCPMGHCPLDHKCPCHHTKRIPRQAIPARMVGSSMHLAVLLKLDRLSIDSYDMSKMQTALQSPNRAQRIYFQLQPELQPILQQENDLDEHKVRTLVRTMGMHPPLAVRAVKTISRLIVELVNEKK